MNPRLSDCKDHTYSWPLLFSFNPHLHVGKLRPQGRDLSDHIPHLKRSRINPGAQVSWPPGPPHTTPMGSWVVCPGGCGGRAGEACSCQTRHRKVQKSKKPYQSESVTQLTDVNGASTGCQATRCIDETVTTNITFLFFST